MKIVLLSPSSPKHIHDGEAVEIAVRLLGEDQAETAGARLTWSVAGAQGRLAEPSTTTDSEGEARNRLFVAGAADPQGCSVMVRASNGDGCAVGMFHVSSGADDSGPSGFFIPDSRSARQTSETAPPLRAAASRATRPVDDETGLQIYYPPSNLLIPFNVGAPLWAQYTQADGAPVAGEYVDGAITNGVFGVRARYTPQDGPTITYIGVTDDGGWLKIAFSFLGETSDFPNSINPTRGTAQTTDLTFELDDVNDPSVVTYGTVTASVAAGGQGTMTLPIDAPVVGRWTLMQASLNLADGTPARYRPLIFTPRNLYDRPGGELTMPFQAEGVQTDDAGNAYNFVWVDWPDSSIIFDSQILVGLIVSSPNAFSSNFWGDVTTIRTQIAAPVTGQPQPQSTITLQWLDPLTLNAPVRVQATFKRNNANHTPISGATITWNAPPSFPGFFDDLATTTGSDGVTINTLHVTTQVSTYSVGVWADSTDPDTDAYVNGPQVGLFTNPNNPRREAYWVVTVEDMGQGFFEATVTDAQDQVVVGQPVTWLADPSNRIAFSPPYPVLTNASGVASVQVAATGTGPVTAAITAQVANPRTCAFYADTAQYNSGGGTTETIQITSPDGNSLPLYGGHPLTATTNDLSVTEIVWSTGEEQPQPDQTHPGHAFTFDRNPTPVSGGTATTQVTAGGPNAAISSVTIYARSTNPGSAAFGSTYLSFTTVPSPPSTSLGVVSLDGNPLSNNDLHLLKATYAQADGTPLGQQQINWQVDNSAVTLLAASTDTLEDGSTTNGVQYSGTDSLTATVTATAPDGVTGVLTFDFRPEADLNTENQGTITITSPDGLALSIDGSHPLNARYLDSDQEPVQSASIQWAAYPANQISLGSDTTTTLPDGTTANSITASGTTAFTGYVSATSFNARTGQNDYGELQLSFQLAVSGITIASPDGDSLPLYSAHQLTATNADTSAQIATLVWSTDHDEDADYTLVLSPNETPLTGGAGSTTITAYGPNQDLTVTVYARSADPQNFPPIGSRTLAFKAATPPSTRIIGIESLDGDPLSAGSEIEDQWHVVRATYRQADGTAVPHAPLTWSVSVDQGSGTVGLAVTSGGQTGLDGSMTNAVKVAGTGQTKVTLTVSADGTTDTAGLKLTFQPNPVQLSHQGAMEFTSPQNGSVLTLNTPQTLSVQYVDGDQLPVADGTEVTWMAYPSDQIVFGDGSAGSNVTTTTGGVATVDVTASPPAISLAVFTATAFNSAVGANDHTTSDLEVSFQTAVQSGLSGIMVEKANCLSSLPLPASAGPPNKVVACRLQINGASGMQTVRLPTTPTRAAEAMFDPTTGQQLPLDGDVYLLQFDPSTGPATFVVGSSNFTYFTINAQWQGDPSPLPVSAPIVVELGSGTLLPPIIEGFTSGVLNIPPAPNPTFQVTLPVMTGGVTAGESVALVLNDHVVWEGAYDPTTPIEVAYSLLNVGSGTNTLIYVTGELTQSRPATGAAFAAAGVAQEGPNTGGVQRTLGAPTVQANANSVGPGEIVGTGLPVFIPPYASSFGAPAAGDQITLYAYLTNGTDVLTNLPLTNIVAVKHTVLQSDPLVSGGRLALPLPQWAMAGYANGQLQVDYKVVPSAGQPNDPPLWSQLSPGADSSYAMNTTFTYATSS